MKNYAILITRRRESEFLQELLFSIGFLWVFDKKPRQFHPPEGNNYLLVINVDTKRLYLSDVVHHITYHTFVLNHNFAEICDIDKFKIMAAVGFDIFSDSELFIPYENYA